MNSIPLIKDLALFSSDLSFIQRVNFNSEKMSRVLSFISLNTNGLFNIEILIISYVSFVRLALKCDSIVWLP